MIIYQEKGPGLHEAVSLAGHWLREENGVWVSSDDAVVQAIIDGYTLVQARAKKCVEITAFAKSIRDRVVASVSAGEMASWSIKATEAARFNVDPTSPCPMLSLEAQARGITLADLVGKVNGNTQRFSQAEAIIGGNDGRHRDAVMSLGDFGAIANYDYSTGWPAV